MTLKMLDERDFSGASSLSHPVSIYLLVFVLLYIIHLLINLDHVINTLHIYI